MTDIVTTNDLLLIAPAALLVALAALLLLVEVFIPIKPRLAVSLVLLTFIGAAVAVWMTGLPPKYFEADGGPITGWLGMIHWGGLTQFFQLFFLASAALVTWISAEFDQDGEIQTNRTEFYVIPLITTAGMLLLASATNLIMVFVAVELVTISFYILVAFQRSQLRSLEAGVKYLILGALSSAFLIMGIAWMYGSLGPAGLSFVNMAAAFNESNQLAGMFGLILFLLGLCFKLAAVPLHFWAPDVYEGAPTPITAFLSVASKAAGFVVLVNLLLLAGDFSTESRQILAPMLGAIAGLSMLLGNLTAMPQRNIKRMLAYSSIGHTGYLLLALLPFLPLDGAGPTAEIKAASLSAFSVYLITYFFASLTAFLVIAIVGRQLKSEQIHNYAGLAQRSPLLAWALAISLVSLAGIPPLFGFIGKLSVFAVAWQAQLTLLFWVGVVSAVIGLYYYLGVVKAMFWRDPIDTEALTVSLGSKVLLFVLCAAMIVFGLWMNGVALFLKSMLPVFGG